MATIKVKCVHLPRDKQRELASVFPGKNGKPLAESTVSNYMNSYRYPQAKYAKMRDFAVKYLGGQWYDKTVFID